MALTSEISFSTFSLIFFVLLNFITLFLIKRFVEGIQLLPSLDFHVLMMVNYSRGNFYFYFLFIVLLHWVVYSEV